MIADVVVAGLGAAGSAALYHLARRGVRVMGLDRFDPPHAKGSTHGGSRIVRRAYFEGAQYVPLLARAYQLWSALEQESGQALFTRCGCLNIAPRGSAMIADARRSAAAANVDTVPMRPEEVRTIFPAFHLRKNEVALFEPDAGAIDPEQSVAIHLGLAQAHGAHVFINEPVRSWEEAPGGIRVHTALRTIRAKRLVLTVGAWIRPLLQGASPPVRVERMVNAWFTTMGDAFAPARCPTFIWEHKGVHLYGFPDFGRGLKAGLHAHGTPVDHPAKVDRTIREREKRALRTPLLSLFPRGLGPAARAITCLYTNTPDRHYLIDHLPDTKRRIIVASACSGHGFKSSPAVGEALADLATEQTPQVDMTAFRLRWPQR